MLSINIYAACALQTHRTQATTRQHTHAHMQTNKQTNSVSTHKTRGHVWTTDNDANDDDDDELDCTTQNTKHCAVCLSFVAVFGGGHHFPIHTKSSTKQRALDHTSWLCLCVCSLNDTLAHTNKPTLQTKHYQLHCTHVRTRIRVHTCVILAFMMRHERIAPFGASHQQYNTHNHVVDVAVVVSVWLYERGQRFTTTSLRTASSTN